MVDFGNILKSLRLRDNMTQAGLAQEEIDALLILIRAMKKR